MCAGGLHGSGSSFRRADGHLLAGDWGVEAVGKVWPREVISQTDGVGRRDDAPHFDSTLPTKLSGAGRADVDSSAHLLHELELLSNTSAAVSPPTNPPGQPPS